MSAAILREAARLMRERAEAATGSPWVAFRARATNPLDREPVIGVTRDLAVDYDTDLFATRKCKPEDAEHIASWHPVTALAVADWLDAQAALVEGAGDFFDDEDSVDSAALAVARAYLGTDA